MCLIPVMTIMWLATTLCMLATIPKITLLAGLALASCVTCTDPVLSQAVAKGMIPVLLPSTLHNPNRSL